MTDLLTVTNADHAFVEHEHSELAAGIERLHELGSRVGSVTPQDLADGLLHVLDWFDRVFVPHAVWEEHTLYDRIDARAGTVWTTKLMRFEHFQIRRLATDLATDRQRLLAMPTHDLLTELRSDVFGMEALIRAHVEREEAFLFPLLVR
jgi:hemerythrin-like domain-containing protein